MGRGSPSLSPGRGAVGELALEGGGGVWAVGKLSWLGPAFPWPAPLCHQLLRQLSVVAVGIWLLPSITNLHLLQSRSLKLV